MAGVDLGELAFELEEARCARLDERERIDEPGDPERLGLVARVEAPDRVRDRLLAESVFVDQRLFGEPHERGPDAETLRELVVGADAEERLFLDRDKLVALVRDADVAAGGEVGRVDDRDGARGVIDGIVRPFDQLDVAAADLHRVLDDREAEVVELFDRAAKGSVDAVDVLVRPLSSNRRFLVVEVLENELGDGFVFGESLERHARRLP